MRNGSMVPHLQPLAPNQMLQGAGICAGPLDEAVGEEPPVSKAGCLLLNIKRHPHVRVCRLQAPERT